MDACLAFSARFSHKRKEAEKNGHIHINSMTITPMDSVYFPEFHLY